MNSQSFDYWLSQSQYIPSHQTTVFELPADLSVSKVPSLSGSPVSTIYDNFAAPMNQGYYPQLIPDTESNHYGTNSLPMTPSDFGSEHDSSYYSPRPPQPLEPVYSQAPGSGPTERAHTTSGRRRAQNRAAQRAFRERKEKHARDLEIQVAQLSDKNNKLETDYAALRASYEKLRKTIELLTQDDDAEGEDEDGNVIRRKSGTTDTLRRLLDIIHGEIASAAVKTENN